MFCIRWIYLRYKPIFRISKSFKKWQLNLQSIGFKLANSSTYQTSVTQHTGHSVKNIRQQLLLPAQKTCKLCCSGKTIGSTSANPQY